MKVEEELAREPRWRPSPWLLVLLAVGLLVVVAARGVDNLLPSISNPFRTEERDRTGPAVLERIEDLARYQAATGNFQVVLDIEEDARFMPDFLRGERTIFVAAGTVDAYVDFSHLDDDAITVVGDTVRIRVPSAQLSEPRVDPERSYVVARERGVLDRIGGVFSDSPTGERELYLRAEQRLVQAARETELTERAERNTADMLEGMLRTLGYEQVVVEFEAPPT